MDGRRFPTEPWNGESENPRIAPDGSFALFGESPFFWLLFFGPAKKSNPLVRGERKPLIFVLAKEIKVNSFRPEGRVTFFALPKKVTKERRFLEKSKRTASGSRGFSDSASCLGRKTAHIHVRRPPGLEPYSAPRLRGRAESRSDGQRVSAAAETNSHAQLARKVGVARRRSTA